MTFDNVCTIMNTANSLGPNKLVQSSCEFIFENKSVFSIGQMNQLSAQCFQLIIASDNLAFAETDVLKVVLDWAENQCQKQHLPLTASNKRRVLGDILFLMRFLLVGTEVTADTGDTGLLTPEEQLEIFKSARGKSAIGGKFSSVQRRRFTSRCLVPKELYEHGLSPVKLLVETSKSVNLLGILCKSHNVVQTMLYRPYFIVYPGFRKFDQNLSVKETYRKEVRTKQKISVSEGNTEHMIMLPAVLLTQNEYHLLYFKTEEQNRKRSSGSMASITPPNHDRDVLKILHPDNGFVNDYVVIEDIELKDHFDERKMVPPYFKEIRL